MHLLNAMLLDLATDVKCGKGTVSFFLVKTPIITVYLVEVEGNARNWAIIFNSFLFGDADHVVMAVIIVKEIFIARLCVLRALILLISCHHRPSHFLKREFASFATVHCALDFILNDGAMSLCLVAVPAFSSLFLFAALFV